ncbi:MAG TPA: 4'-phosphopantetheinyl transferase superfamily protein [Acidisarcina sp.]
MAGEAKIDQVVAYLTRLMGSTPTVDEPLKLRSVHRAALASWARKGDIPIRQALISSAAPFSVRELLSDGGRPTVPVAAVGAAASAAPLVGSTLDSALVTLGGIGIDIEEVDMLPETHDYREHSFYQDTFTPSELAYCLMQADVKASLCGTWAAKEAILKSGVAHSTAGHLKAIEVTRDNAGRPQFPGCKLSISHTGKTAVAVCVALSTSTASSAGSTAS